MNLKSSQSKPPANEGSYQLPVDSCNHSSATSLRDLRNKYLDLSREQANSTDVNKTSLAEVVHETK